jgi:transposase
MATLQTFRPWTGAVRSDQPRVGRRRRLHCQDRGQQLPGRGADPFHVVRWAADALDLVRRQAWNDARRLARATETKRATGRPPANAPARPATERARGITGAWYALWKNPENLTEKQRAKLEWIARIDPRLYRAFQLKEGLRLIFQMPIEQAQEAPGALGQLRPAMPAPGVRETAEDYRRAHPVDLGRDRARPVC